MTIHKENALEVFTGEKLDDYLKAIKDDALNFVADIKTATGRKQIASKAHSVAKEKVRIDDIRKALVSDWKQKAKLVDLSGKKSRDFLDDLKAEVRKPLNDWEAKEEKRIQAEFEAAEFELAYEEAIGENELFNRKKEVERREEELRQQEQEKLAKEQAEREKQERLEREARIAQEAKEKAEKEAQEKIEAERRAKIEAELKAKQDAERAEQEKADAAEKAEREKREAIAKAKADEQERLAKIQREKEEKEKLQREADEKKAANVAHQRKINREALAGFVSMGIEEELGIDIIRAIAANKIKNITINY